jgi:hypothetical protein
MRRHSSVSLVIPRCSNVNTDSYVKSTTSGHSQSLFVSHLLRWLVIRVHALLRMRTRIVCVDNTQGPRTKENEAILVVENDAIMVKNSVWVVTVVCVAVVGVCR